MKDDINGCSICQKGQENYETYFDWRGEEKVQYDYRTDRGKLFSCVRASIEKCRAARDAWLKKMFD